MAFLALFFLPSLRDAFAKPRLATVMQRDASSLVPSVAPPSTNRHWPTPPAEADARDRRGPKCNTKRKGRKGKCWSRRLCSSALVIGPGWPPPNTTRLCPDSSELAAPFVRRRRRRRHWRRRSSIDGSSRTAAAAITTTTRRSSEMTMQAGRTPSENREKQSWKAKDDKRRQNLDLIPFAPTVRRRALAALHSTALLAFVPPMQAMFQCWHDEGDYDRRCILRLLSRAL